MSKIPAPVWISLFIAALSLATSWGSVSSASADQKVVNGQFDTRLRAVEINSSATAQALKDIHDDLKSIHQDLEKQR